jgi:DNA-binding transcriptional LysR family regulator
LQSSLAEPLLLVATADHYMAAAEQVGAAELADEPILLTKSGCGYRALFIRTLTLAGLRPSTALEFGSVEAIKQCVAAGLGVAALPAIAVAHELAEGRLVALRWADGEMELTTHASWHTARGRSPNVRAFLEVVRESIGVEERRPSAPD